ncbi:MAG TPA: hydrogenase maturation nickel metallochaperone HypA [Verrucomicrobiae bacterium]|jgi:hydrogenase nickel incorporation protein HypA/HybF
MHELGVTQEIIEVVAGRAHERKVKRIVLEIGRLSCILPDAIRFCFELCSEGTVAHGAALEIQQPSGRGRCRQCGSEVVIDRLPGQCGCGKSDLEWLAGEELRIKEMELA